EPGRSTPPTQAPTVPARRKQIAKRALRLFTVRPRSGSAHAVRLRRARRILTQDPHLVARFLRRAPTRELVQMVRVVSGSAHESRESWDLARALRTLVIGPAVTDVVSSLCFACCQE